MNPFSALTWIWKALRGHSVTFAALFATAVLGVSVLRYVKLALGSIGTPWWAMLILPTILVGVVAKREAQWMPDAAVRRRWARGLVFGSLALAVLIAVLTPPPPPDPDAPPPPERPTGPRGR